jgi:GNAT superfamily N-acetyltransferase
VVSGELHRSFEAWWHDFMGDGEAIEVRGAELPDVARIRAFGVAHIRAHYEPLIGEPAAQRQVDDWWNERVIRSAVVDGSISVAEDRNGLIGVVQVARQADPPTVYKLYVHPDHRGRGVGVALLTEVMASLPTTATRLAVEHFAGNVRAASFYEREGFVVDRVARAETGDSRLAVVWRVKALK